MREELLQHPNGLDVLRSGIPFNLASPATPLIDLQPPPPELPMNSDAPQPVYKAKRPAALQVQGLETYHSLRSLQAPFADTPMTASFTAKRKRPGTDGELAKLQVQICRGCCAAIVRANK